MAERKVVLKNGTVLQVGGRYTHEMCKNYFFFEIIKIGYKQVHYINYYYNFSHNSFVKYDAIATLSIKTFLQESFLFPCIEVK